jgi:dTDP-4-amino-4,6-dideoxygalactose transaminase
MEGFMMQLEIPFFRPDLAQDEIDEVVATLRSGWLTTGPRVKRFEKAFAAAVGATRAVALNSCTAALHLGVEALGLKPGQGVLVPTMTFAATAEVVRYLGGVPLLVDCHPVTTNMCLADAARKIRQLRAGELPIALDRDMPVAGIMPVHVGGMMMDVKAIQDFASANDLWIVEDAAHAFPAAWRKSPAEPWQRCGEGTAAVSCFSFYANKTITTGEGGMAVTESLELADRMRLMSLHGLSQDAWNRYAQGGSWDYLIVAPGYKYNLTDIAAALGIHQLARAEALRQRRQDIAHGFLEALADVEEIELPPDDPDRIHAWHLFPIRLRLDKLAVDRSTFISKLKQSGIGCSVHWRPLHLHPYYQQTFGWEASHFPVASSLWQQLVSLPIYPTMSEAEFKQVVEVIKATCAHPRRAARAASGAAS